MEISFARYELLALIQDTPAHAIAMKTAANTLNLPPATVTHTVNQLEKQGLVHRMRDPEDGRGILVATTATGAKLVDTAKPLLGQLLNKLDISESEQEQLLKLTTALRQAAEKL
ncbi:MarR family transcriptional regulator [Staphylococcus chromogenes]|nr:MarR family transcriptional regulator [Staphylococcus chromogenes]